MCFGRKVQNRIVFAGNSTLMSRLRKGRYLYDVRTEGERGVTQYVTNTTDMLRECMTKGGGGPKM